MAYQFQTTFWMDFTIADRFGIDAVKNTFNRSFRDWKTDHIYLTELTLVMNWKCWQHYEAKHMELSKLYQEYYYQLRDYGLDNLKGKELTYFIKTLD